MLQNLLKMEQNLHNIATMSENTKVHLDLCFTYPNCSPHDPESTQIGREDTKIHENILKTRMRQKNTKKQFFIYLGIPKLPQKPQKWVAPIDFLLPWDPPERDFSLIWAHPSCTFPEK